jgi:peroxiredoxin
MRTRILASVALCGLVGSAAYWLGPIARAAEGGAKAAAAKVGEAAPDIALKDTYGKEFKLSEFKGKIVVLEWLNQACPVSRGKHEDKTMQNTYKKYADKVVWIGIDTTNGVKPESNRVYAAKMQLAHPILIDVDAKAGHAFGAKTTPHMFVIDKDGKLAYDGAIDDQGQTNYVAAAIDSLVAGKPVSKSKTDPYGCGVKYGGR